MSVTCVFGMQWGDEGKGRIIDLLAAESDIVVRYQGGANAGHTVIVGTEKYVLHLLPSGVLHEGVMNVVGNGVVVDPWTLLDEVQDLERRGVSLDGRLLVSDRAHVVLPYHKYMDRALEALRGDASLGTTSRGIGPAYADKYTRDGVRVADFLRPDALRIVKAYSTRVGAGPFPTQDVGPAGAHMGEKGREVGATTGRKRQCGWFDAVVARAAVRTQGVDSVALMKLDVLSGLDQLKVCTAYEVDGRRVDTPPASVAHWRMCRPVYETFPGWREDLGDLRRFDDLPSQARTFVRFLETQMGVPIQLISVGAERARVIQLETPTVPSPR